MILVTGASGVLGSALTRRLVAAGEKVAVLTLPDDPAHRLDDLRGRIERRDGDVIRPSSLTAACEGVSDIFHAAAIVPFCNALRDQMQAVNADGTRALLAAAAARGVRSVVHVSSVSTVGLPVGGETLDEDHVAPAIPSGYAYVDTKRAAEGHAFAAAAAGRRVVIVNPAAIVAGDGQDPFSWAHLVKLVARRRLRFNLPGGLCLVSERDVVDGLLAAWQRGISGRRYILATANLSFAELFAEVTQQAGVPLPRWTLPRGLLVTIGALNTLRNRLAGDPLRSGAINRENAALLAERLYYSSARARRELGFSPGSVSQLVADVLARMKPLS